MPAVHSAQFVVSLDGRKTNLFLDPYSGQVLGTQDAQNNLQAIARALHGTLLIGTVGDRLIELAAGWAIVLVVSGLYLWWPRGQGMRGVFWPRLTARGRLFWRDLHAVNMHGLLNLETNLEMYGRIVLGLKPNTPLI